MQTYNSTNTLAGAQDYSELTVMILTFNRAEQLRRSLQSVKDSDIQPREILVVDNASTDETQAVATSFECRYIRTHRNLGCPAGRNLGIANATGSLVYMLDDDGWLDPAALREIVDAYRELTSRGEKIAALTSHVVLTQKANVSGKRQAIRHGQWRQLKSFSGGASLFVKDAFFRAGCYPDDFWGYGEEVDLSLRLIDSGFDIYQIPQSVMYHEPQAGQGRINKNYVYYNLRNTLYTVSDLFPWYLVLPATVWYSARWLFASVSMGNSHFAILGMAEGLSKLPIRVARRTRPISFKALLAYLRRG